MGYFIVSSIYCECNCIKSLVPKEAKSMCGIRDSITSADGTSIIAPIEGAFKSQQYFFETLPND